MKGPKQHVAYASHVKALNIRKNIKWNFLFVWSKSGIWEPLVGYRAAHREHITFTTCSLVLQISSLLLIILATANGSSLINLFDANINLEHHMVHIDQALLHHVVIWKRCLILDFSSSTLLWISTILHIYYYLFFY